MTDARQALGIISTVSTNKITSLKGYDSLNTGIGASFKRIMIHMVAEEMERGL